VLVAVTARLSMVVTDSFSSARRRR